MLLLHHKGMKLQVRVALTPEIYKIPARLMSYWSIEPITGIEPVNLLFTKKMLCQIELDWPKLFY